MTGSFPGKGQLCPIFRVAYDSLLLLQGVESIVTFDSFTTR
jgi:hypothetical protein